MRALSSSRATAPSQVLLGVAAHAAAGACVPSAASLLLVLPILTLAVHAYGRALRASGPAARLVGGQALVHLALATTVRCAAPAPADGPARADLLMAAGHLLVVLACVRLVVKAEARVVALVLRLRAAAARMLGPGRPPAPVHGRRRADVPPVRLAGRDPLSRSGVRGPPPRTALAS